MKHIKRFNESEDKPNNYMFFSNLENMKRMVDELSQMSPDMIDKMLDEHDWASDHMSVATENLEHLYNFFNGMESKNEEINFKALAAGALMALAVSCNRGEVNGVRTETYVGDLKVRKIELAGSKINWFMIHGTDANGKDVIFHTDQLTFNVGDSVHVDFKKGEAYPLNDKENISSVDNYK